MSPAQALKERRCGGGWRLRRLARLIRNVRAVNKRRLERGQAADAPPAKRRRLLLPDPPPRNPEEDGELSRTEVGLELLGEFSPPGLDWTYPVADEAWRCFAGYLPRALKAPETPRFFDLVKKGTKWLQPSGHWGPLPLKTAWMTSAPCSCRYGYGGAVVLPEAYPDWMKEILTACMPLCGLDSEAQWPNSCNLNLYVDGQFSVGWHADNESLFQGKVKDCRIISLSLGQTRRFELECKGGPKTQLDLSDGDLCTMEGLTQKYYKHRVPKENGRKVKERINLTWRWIVQHTSECPVCPVAAAAA